MLRWIAFDAVGTLIYPDPEVASAYAMIAGKHGSRLTPEEIRPKFRTLFAESIAACLPSEEGQVLTNETLETERWRWIVERALPDVASPEACYAELYEHFARSESWRLYADVAETLRQLRDLGLRIAIASNFDQRLHAVCRGLPELKGIEQIVVSTEVGACKPSPRFFTALLDACGCAADELLMVGDEIEADILGPQKSGIPAVLIDRNGTAESPGAIQSLSELIAKLA